MIEYELKNEKILKDGHTMLLKDVVTDLNRKSFLENERKVKLESPSVLVSTWIFFNEGYENNPQFKVQACAQWEAYEAAKDHYGPQVEGMMYKMLIE